MSQSYIQNTNDTSIYHYIKTVNKPLYEVIKNTGAKNIFMKSNITFLMPNETLLNKILNVSQKESLNILKQLLLIGTINNLSEFSQSVYNIYNFRLNNPSSLNIKIDPMWKNNKYCSLFLYDGSDIPESSKVVNNKKSGSSTKANSYNYKLQKHKEVLKKYSEFVNKNKKGINPFVMGIANILSLVKNDKEKYLQICDLMDNNAIITWFLIMQLGLEENPILSNEFFQLKTIEHPQPYKEYSDAFENININIDGQNWFKTVSNVRKQLVNYFDISLPDEILKAYGNNYTKLLQDEIRFKYRNSNEYHWTDIVEELEYINWDYPQNHIIFGNEEMCKYLIQDEDKFYSGPVKFVKSIYFMYKPLSKKFYGQLVEKTKKSCADPYANGIVYGDNGDRDFTDNNEERRGYNIKSVWNSFNELEKEQMKEFSQVSKLNNKDDMKHLWESLSVEQKDYIKELSA